MTYLTWWQGGLLLAAVTILFQLLLRKSLGVSGSWAQFAFRRATQQRYHEQQQFHSHTADMQQELLRLTQQEFGAASLNELQDENNVTNTRASTAASLPWGVHVVFLLSIVLGAFLVTLYDGSFKLSYELSAFHTLLSGEGWKLMNTLFIGGVMVGFGTQMAGGCTSGHGLSGCANFSWVSYLSISIVVITASLLAFFVKAFVV